MAKSSIVWALDPGMANASKLKNLARAISGYPKVAAAPVFPVSVLAPADLGWASELTPLLRTNSRTVMKSKIKPIIRKAGLNQTEAPTVLVQPERSNRLASE